MKNALNTEGGKKPKEIRENPRHPRSNHTPKAKRLNSLSNC